MMIDFSNITGFEWDPGNERKNADRHHVSQLEAEQVFFNQPLLVLDDNQHSQHENRLHAYGKTDGERLLHVSFTLRQNDRLIRVISARPMHKKERYFYDQEK